MNTQTLLPSIARAVETPNKQERQRISRLRQGARWVFNKLPNPIKLPIEAIHGRRISHRAMSGAGIFAVNRLVADKHGLEIKFGPFAGLKLTKELTDFDYTGAYTLGLYEKWLEKAYKNLFEKFSPRQCINIGASGGVESVAIARRFPLSEGFAFDTDPLAQEIVKGLATANGVSNLSVRGMCTRRWLENNLVKNSFILSDCEGFESVLFKTSFPALEKAVLLVELHPNKITGTVSDLFWTFGHTHKITEIAMDISWRNNPEIIERTAFLGPLASKVTDDPLRSAGDKQRWWYMVPKP